LLKATNKITAYAPQIEHQPCKPLNRPRQNAMPDTHLEKCSKARTFQLKPAPYKLTQRLFPSIFSSPRVW
jgi:hypothetical protein